MKVIKSSIIYNSDSSSIYFTCQQQTCSIHCSKVISAITTQSYTSHYCYKTRKGRKHYESISPEIPTLPVKAFKKKSGSSARKRN
jgi:hypothetical protein